MPHFEGGEVPQAITFRLAGSLPRALLDKWHHEAAPMPEPERARYVSDMVHGYLDLGVGGALLTSAGVGDAVEQTLLWADGIRYRLHAWVVMPNHVHALLTPARGTALSGILKSWKSYSARRINTLLSRTGSLWQPDYFDRYIRDELHYNAELAYIHANPVKAGLCAEPTEWPWGSARRSADLQVRTDTCGPGGPRSDTHR